MSCHRAHVKTRRHHHSVSSELIEWQTLVQLSMWLTGIVLPRMPRRCSFKFSRTNCSMYICTNTHTHTHAQTQRLIHVVFDYSTLTSLFELQGNAKNELAAVNAKDAKYFTRYSNNNCTNWTELNWIETLLYAKPATDEESRPAGVACRRPCWRWRWTRCSRAVWVVIEVGPPAVTSSSRAPPVDLCQSTQPPSCVVQTIVSCAVTGGRRLAGGSRRSSSLTSRRRPPVSGTDASGVTVSSRHCCGLSRRSQTRRDLHTHTHTRTHARDIVV